MPDRSKFVVVLPALFLITACGADPTAPEKCGAFIEAMCANRRDNCFPSVEMVDCRASFTDENDCATAYSVSDTYDACIEFIDSSTDCLENTTDLPDFCDSPITWKN